MKPKFSRRYQVALLSYLRKRSTAGLNSAQGMGQGYSAGLQTLDLAKLHEHILITEVLPGCAAGKRTAIIKQAGTFFAMAITPMEKTHHSSRTITAQLKKFVETLSQRTVELSASNLEIKPGNYSTKGGGDGSPRKANLSLLSIAGKSRSDLRDSCGGCPARFSQRRKTSERKSAANCTMSSPRR